MTLLSTNICNITKEARVDKVCYFKWCLRFESTNDWDIFVFDIPIINSKVALAANEHTSRV